jgi:hypothetical protein
MASEQELNRTKEQLKVQEAINAAKQKQRELDADLVGLSSSLVDSIKEVQGISTKRSTFDQNILKINKEINKELLGQKSGLSDISTINKQIQKNKDLILKSQKTENALSSHLVGFDKKRFDLANKRADEISHQQSIQSKLLQQAEQGVDLDKDAYDSSVEAQASAERSLNSLIKKLGPMAQQAVFTRQHTIELEKQKKLREEELKTLNAINDTLGLTGAVTKGLSKIPGIGDKAGKAFDVVEGKLKAIAEEKGVKALPSRFKTMGMFAGEFGKIFMKSVTDPLVVITAIGSAMLKNNAKITEFERSMAMSSSDAKAFAGEFSKISITSDDLNTTTANLVHNFQDMSAALGFMARFSNNTLETATKLQYTLGVSAESVANLAGAATTGSGEFEDQYKNALLASHEVQREYGTRVDMRKVMEQTGKISGILRANLGANIKSMAAAVTKATLFGSTLEDVANAGSALLDFESSITKELEAELLTGKNLNLERARAAALAGDQVTLMEELGNQMGSLSDFQDMNVIQQQALAGAMGMTGDQLADILMKQEIQGRTAEQLKAAGKDELAAMVEKQSAQESFNAAVAQLKGLFADTMKFLDPILQGFSSIVKGAMQFKEEIGFVLKAFMGIYAVQQLFNAASLISATIQERRLAAKAAELGLGGQILTVLGFQNAIAGYQLAKEEGMNTLRAIGVALEETKLGSIIAQGVGMLKNIGKLAIENAARLVGMTTALATNAAVTFGVGVAIAVGAAAAGYAAIKAMTGDDVMSPGGSGSGYGSRTLLGPEGAIALNNRDTVIAGTNLFPKEGRNSGSQTVIQQDNSETKRTNQLLATLIGQNAKKPELSPVGLYEVQ